MTWFPRLTGVDEQSPEQVRRTISIDGEFLHSPAGHYRFGRLDVARLSDLRTDARNDDASATTHEGVDVPTAAIDEIVDVPPATIDEVVADVRDLHADPANAGAVFQVASQFNLLEMTGPTVTPERGVGIYQDDPTQGPACAIACGAGTIYRNYFVPIRDRAGRIIQRGQTADRQIDTTADLFDHLAAALRTTPDRLRVIRNGYLFPTRDGLPRIRDHLAGLSDAERAHARDRLRVGVQRDTDVTIIDPPHRVTQVYAAAAPIAYDRNPTADWEPLARLILESAYESTYAVAAAQAAGRPTRQPFYLTLLGGGVFGNPLGWILDAIRRAHRLYRHHPLDVRVVSYGGANPDLRSWLRTVEETPCPPPNRPD